MGLKVIQTIFEGHLYNEKQRNGKIVFETIIEQDEHDLRFSGELGVRDLQFNDEIDNLRLFSPIWDARDIERPI